MDFALTDEHRSLQTLARDFAEKELRPIARQIDLSGTFPQEAVKKLGELGFMGISIPESYGGSELDPVAYVVIMEEISRVCASTAVTMSVNNSLACEVLKNFGTEEQKQKFLISMAKGETLGAYCLTEPMSGSDAATMKTSAKKEGDHYVINGAKNWITNGPDADTLILFAMTDPTQGNRGITAFVLDAKSEGVEIGAKENKLGIRASSTCTISFTDVKVPESQRLREEGFGFKVAMATLDNGRIGIAAQALGIAQAAYESALSYAKERKQFDQSLAEFQGIRWMIADMASRIEASRLLIYQAAYKKSLGGRFTKYSAIAKLFASETASFVTNTALQIHGGYGYTKEYDVERFVRDARICEIYEGTSEIQRLVIASQSLKEIQG
ncbi:MAG: acyl-CoA dehydrogenase [Bdellovibrionales bacterium]|nr:acyl-CoA dehydrogenase [Bdellovibrionales bacterium]